MKVNPRWVGRDFWAFIAAATVATIFLSYFVHKCETEPFDHRAATEYFDIWGNTVVLFWIVFTGGDGIDKVISVLPTRGGARRIKRQPPAVE